MRKFALLLTCILLCGFHVVFAQSRTITGTVTDADDGASLPGVSVVVKGTSIGTVTDIDGKFSINAPSDAQTLVFSFVGMEKLEFALTSANSYNVKLSKGDIAVDEVVVTALGISREKKALGYAVSDVSGSELEKARGGVSNPMNALAGKVAGLQITGSSGNMGGSSKIVLRGVKSISGSNQPLFVIDGVPIEGTDFNSTDTQRGAGGYDYGNLIQDINPDDIQSISVLKGPNASALYGSRATNGVVMITTKKGKAGKGLGVSFNSSFGVEKVNKLPVMQKLYGGGSASTFSTAQINGKTYNTPEYDMDESWGPKYDGQQVVSWYDLAKWEAQGKVGDPTTSEWKAAANDIDQFFELGTNFTNNISISQASDNASIRVSYTNMTLKGFMPNSSMSKNSFSINGNAKVKDRYDVFSNINYISQKATGRSETGYADNNVMQKFVQWGQRQLDMKELKDLYEMPDGTQATWNRVAWDDPTPNYSNNPYWSRYKNYQNDSRDRLYGNAGVKAFIIPSLTAQYKVNLDFFSDKQYERNAVFSQEESRYAETHRQQFELNHEFLLMYNNKFGDFSVAANLGANLMYQRYRRLNGETQSGLILPEFYNLNNSKSPALAENFDREKAINSVFASATVDYKGFVFVDATIRNDVSSTLPQGNNSYYYPSFTGSLLFSELINQSWLNFGKVRAGWAKVGGDTDPYRVLETYTFYSTYGAGGFINSLSKKNPNLKPEKTQSLEAGLELSFLDNRVGLDVSVYKSITTDQIIPLSLSGTTGRTSTIINAGELQNQGFEVMFKGVPVKTRDFEWNTTLTLSRNTNKVNKLTGDVSYYRLANAPFKVEVGAIVGEKYGVIMGTDFQYDENGNKIVSATGRYLSTNGNVPLGSVYPDLMGGLMNSFRYKNIDFSILFDGQWGGKFFSTSHMWGMYSGMLEETAANNELGNPVRDAVTADEKSGGVLLEGVLADGTVNTKRISAVRWAADHYSGPAAQNVFKSDFIKLREISLGYTLPLRNNVIQDLKISAYGRNLAIWGPDTKHFDPESATTSSGNIQGIEGGALPSVASFGVNVGFKF